MQCTPLFEGSLPWLESKWNLNYLEAGWRPQLLKLGIKDILFLPCRLLEGYRAHRGKVLYNPRIHVIPFALQVESSKNFRGEMVAKNLNV
jgi:hypothetical protein